MLALLLSILLFISFSAIGLALMQVFPARLKILQGILISPALGIATIILPVFLLNRTGLPVKQFGGWLLLALVGLALIVLAFRKPILPWRHLRWIGLILLGALLLSAWPMLLYGFDWVSFANDDMANYALGAQRFLNHGYFDLPQPAAILNGMDSSQAYWFMHVAGGSRSGSELMLAAIWAATGLNAHQNFMPVIVALHLALVCSGAALVAGPIRSARQPLIVLALLAISSLTTLGVIYQLIGQVGGLAMLSAAVILFYRKVPIRPATRLLKSNMVGALIFGGLFVWYPEVLPFLGLGWIAYLGMTTIQIRGSAFRIIAPALLIGTLTSVFLGGYVLTSLRFLIAQAFSGSVSVNSSAVLFPYFLIPGGMPAILGMVPIGGAIDESMLSVAIAAAIALLFWLGRSLFIQFLEMSAASSVLVVMVVTWILLFYTNGAFGLFKLSMLAQPFLLAVVGTAIAKWSNGRRTWKIAVVAGAIAANVASQFAYVNKSTGEAFGGQQNLPGASSQGLNSQFSKLMESLSEKDATISSDAESIVLAKFQALYLAGKGGRFLSRDFFGLLVRKPTSTLRESYDLSIVDPLREEYAKGYKEEIFAFGSKKDSFRMNSALHGEGISLVTTNRRQTIFNSRDVSTDSHYFKIVNHPINHLIFINSEFGNHYYLGDYLKGIGYYPLERDPMLKNGLVSGMGRYQLLMALGASDKPRIVVELSATVMRQFSSALPVPTIQGKDPVVLPFIGRGAGRVFSVPVSPQSIDGFQYLGIDMGRDGQQFPSKRAGLSLLYGRNVPVDQRRLSAFGRDVSLISEEEFQAMQPPQSVANFPSDLTNQSLEYSGIYEDGWISERAFFTLAPQADARYLLIKGMAPLIDKPDFHNTLSVSVDGREVSKQAIGLGNFEIKFPAQADGKRHRIDLAFDRYQTLPGADGRPTGGKIEFIGFTKG